MRAQTPRHVGLPGVLSGAGLDELAACHAGRRGGDGEGLVAERARRAGRCHPGAEAEPQQADGLADHGVNRLAETEERDRQAGRDGDLRYRGDAAALLP